MLREEELAAIAARANAATPGPWYFVPVQADADRRDQVAPAVLLSASEDLEICSTSWLDEDGAFIAAARQDVPALLAEVQRLRAGLKQLLVPSENLCGCDTCVTAARYNALIHMLLERNADAA